MIIAYDWTTPKGATQRDVDEQFVLSQLLSQPEVNGWELNALDPAVFTPGPHRAIARAICSVRDSGRRFHWRRVAAATGPVGSYAHKLTRALFYRAGVETGLTAAVSRLHHHARRTA